MTFRSFARVLVLAMALARWSLAEDSDDVLRGRTSVPTYTALSRDVVTGARCRVRCLETLKYNIDLTPLSVKEMTSLMRCLQSPDCSSCMKPCNQPLLSQDRCEDICKFPKEDRVCSDSCRFLKQIKEAASGICPSLAELNVSHSSPLAVDSCSGTSCVTDKNCDKDLKCCVTPCGSYCRKPLSPSSADLPEIPEIVVLRKKTKGGAVELKWNSTTENRTGPVLYIVDSRWNVGKHHDETNMTPWHQVTQTTGTSTVINDITPGHWYQFRVASVSVHGARGGSQPSAAFTLAKEPRKPGPPTNLTEGDTLIAGGTMTVTIRWFPPKKSDIPVTRYKLFWSKRSKSTTASPSGPREQRKVLPGDRLTYQMQNLDSDTTYLVQVQAICQYGDVKLKSEKASIYITTYPLPKAADQHRVPSESSGTVRAHPTPAPVMSLAVGKPFYDSGVLKAKVTWRHPQDDASDVSAHKFLIHWSPEACIADSTVSDDSLSRVMSTTTSENHSIIYDLRTDCRYLVKVEPVSSQGVTGKASVTSFSTPTCSQTEPGGKLQPDCLSNGPQIPGEPPNLDHSILISNSNITLKFSWGIPTSESPINGYRVLLGPILQSHHSNPVRDKSLTVTKGLPKDVRSLSTGNLLEGTTYLVQVQAVTKFGYGQFASLQFTTPLLQLAPIDQPYHEDKKPDVSKKKSYTALPNSPATTTTQKPDHRLKRPQSPSLASPLTNNSFSILTVCLFVLTVSAICSV